MRLSQWYDNMEFFTWCIKSQPILFIVQEQGKKFLSKKKLENIDAVHHYDCNFFWHACIYGFSSVIVFSFEYGTVIFQIVSFVIIIRIMRNVTVVGYVLVSGTIIVRLSQCN